MTNGDEKLLFTWPPLMMSLVVIYLRCLFSTWCHADQMFQTTAEAKGEGLYPVKIHSRELKTLHQNLEFKVFIIKSLC